MANLNDYKVIAGRIMATGSGTEVVKGSTQVDGAQEWTVDSGATGIYTFTISPGYSKCIAAVAQIGMVPGVTAPDNNLRAELTSATGTSVVFQVWDDDGDGTSTAAYLVTNQTLDFMLLFQP